MKAILLDALPAQALEELDEFYHSTKLARLRTRAQMILFNAEQGLKAACIAELVRDNERTVQRWLQRYQAEGVKGLYDAPRSGKPGKVTQAYKDELLEATKSFFDKYNNRKEQILTIIGAHPTKLIECT